MMENCFPVKRCSIRLDRSFDDLEANSLNERNVKLRPSQSPENWNLNSVPGRRVIVEVTK